VARGRGLAGIQGRSAHREEGEKSFLPADHKKDYTGSTKI